MPATEEILMIEPPPALSITGITCFMARKQHINAAIRFETLLDHGRQTGRACRIRTEGARLSTLAANDAHSLLGRRGVDIDAEHARTFAREGYGGCFAVAPAGTDRARPDHDRDFVFQAISHLDADIRQTRAQEYGA